MYLFHLEDCSEKQDKQVHTSLKIVSSTSIILEDVEDDKQNKDCTNYGTCRYATWLTFAKKHLTKSESLLVTAKEVSRGCFICCRW
jgi:hypothetical protein